MLNGQLHWVAEYARALERIFAGVIAALERAIELLEQAERYFALIEATLPPAERRHNAYIWRLLQHDEAKRADESEYEKLERIGYGGSGTSLRALQHWWSANKARSLQEENDVEVSRDAQNSTLKRILQPCGRQRYFM